MLINKYLPAYDFREFHSIKLKGQPVDAYQKMLNCDFSNSRLIKLLFRLRGIRKQLYTIEHLVKMGFTRLDEEPGMEVIFGMVTNSPMFNSCHPDISPDEFMHQSDPKIIKAVINFKVEEGEHSSYIISTETRIWCGSKAMRSKFKRYWFFVKPFSQLIRKAMLKQMRKKII